MKKISVSEHFKVGARGSKLSVAQTVASVKYLEEKFPGTQYEIITVETPGDRDLTTPIEKSAPDFFTRDLDEAVRVGKIDFAIHSAKDMPPEVSSELDWFWLPNNEDSADAWVFRADMKGEVARIGVSSERRSDYAKKMYPNAQLLPIRGAIDSRIEQVKNGAFDAVIMAVAGIKRLYGTLDVDGIRLEKIPLDELPPPEAQGHLAIVFRKGDERVIKIRDRFVKAVRFVSAGVGNAGMCTLAGLHDLQVADVILVDDLLGSSLCERNDVTAEIIHVGKRCGAHSMKQEEITRLICNEARKGKRVVRLKGGDAGIFGRLAEETDALTDLKIPFVVRPGVSALTAATTGTGLLLTRRGESCGFTAFTPRSTGEDFPLVMFMALRMAKTQADVLINSRGLSPATPCAFVYDAAGEMEEVFQTTLGECAENEDLNKGEERPGLFIVGKTIRETWHKAGVFAGKRVLLTCSDAIMDKAVTAVEDFGGKPVRWSLIKLQGTKKFDDLSKYDAIVLTSPSAVRIFFESCKCDRRSLPQFFTCGAGTNAELLKYGVCSDVMPEKDFSAKGLIAEIEKLDLGGKKVLRLRSAKAGEAVAVALKKVGADVDDVVLYNNVFCSPSENLPPFDVVFFASASAVESFIQQYGTNNLYDKEILVMGEPTRSALPDEVVSRCLKSNLV